MAGSLAADYRLVPDDWQQLVLDDWLAEDVAGRYAALSCGLACPRQNGKNGIVEIRELFGMVGRGEKFLHTAHEVKTARKAFKRLQHFFGRKRDDPAANFPELNRLVAEVRNVNGQEAIYLHNGGSVEISARSQGAARGWTVDVLVLDEAQDLSDDDIEALMPTTSAAPLGNPQWIYLGTPPGPRARGEVFTRRRLASLEGSTQRLVWHEWSCESDADLDDREAWRQANPGLGTRLQLAVVEGERTTFSDDGFGRERLGMWQGTAGSAVIDSTSWAELASESGRPVDRFALGIDVAPDRSMSSVSFAGQRADGVWHVELVEQRGGTAWIPAYIEERCERNTIRAVVVDGASPAASLIDQLRERKVKTTVTGAREMVAACANFYDAVYDGQLAHIDQPQLTTALSVARKRSVGTEGGWAWNRKNATSDITPLVAATLALYGAQHTQVKRPMRTRVATTREAVVL